MIVIDEPRIIVPSRVPSRRRPRHPHVTPRRHQPWCPQFRLDTLNAGNRVQVGSTNGRVRVKNNGIVVAGASDPCCCAPPMNCLRCTTTPQVITAVISGVTICPPCIPNDVEGLYHTWFLDLSGTYTINNSAIVCQWSIANSSTGVDAGTTVATRWTNSSCNVVVTTSSRWDISLERVIDGVWRVRVTAYPSPIGESAPPLTYFDSGLVYGFGSDCTANFPFTLNNATGSCGARSPTSSSSYVAGTGGSVAFSL